MHAFSILRQTGLNHIEPQVIAQHAMVADIPIKATTIECLEMHADALRHGTTLPVGSVEFVRKAMCLAGIEEPPNISYPAPLHEHLHRQVMQRPAGQILGTWFIKPVTTKVFSGFVFDTLSDPEHLSGYDQAQYNAFMALPPETPVWVSEPVTWLSEVRYYVIDGEVRGAGRYDDAPEDTPVPDALLVNEMTALLADSPGAPAAFSLDVGILNTGATALIECNDAWALGYYKGTLSARDYTALLWRRWEQLAQHR